MDCACLILSYSCCFPLLVWPNAKGLQLEFNQVGASTGPSQHEVGTHICTCGKSSFRHVLAGAGLDQM